MNEPIHQALLLRDSKSSLFCTYHISLNDKDGTWFEIDDFNKDVSIRIKNEETKDKAKTYFYMECSKESQFFKNLTEVFLRMNGYRD